MKARVIDINRDDSFAWIDLVNYHNKVCLHTQVRRSAVDMRIYYFSNELDSEKEKCLLVNNIGEIINKAFPIFGYSESKKSRIESIVFRENMVNTEYALITFRREKQ